MSDSRVERRSHAGLTTARSAAEKVEMEKLEFLDGAGNPLPPTAPGPPAGSRAALKKEAIHGPAVLNEAYDYPLPSSITRGISVQVKAGTTFLWISGTASVDEQGLTIHAGDFRAQCWRTWRNITELLASRGATWHDVVRTTCYLRDIERDYADFNEVRTHFMTMHGLDPVPASTGIQARLCREDLLVEVEAIALLPGPEDEER